MALRAARNLLQRQNITRWGASSLVSGRRHVSRNQESQPLNCIYHHISYPYSTALQQIGLGFGSEMTLPSSSLIPAMVQSVTRNPSFSSMSSINVNSIRVSFLPSAEHKLRGGRPSDAFNSISRAFATGSKKTKIKPYSSLKRRFKLLANGEFKRWKAGKRHKATVKTKKQRRQLRKPSVVSPGLAYAMKKLNFQGTM